MRPDLPRGDKGGERDVTAVLGAVIDHDADAGRNANEPHEAGYVIETSQRPVSNRQYFVLFDQPLSPVEAKPIVERLHVAYGGDHGTKDLSHVWRVAGTLNWPNKKKLERGRPAEPQSPTVLKAWHGECVTKSWLDQFAARADADRHSRGDADAAPDDVTAAETIAKALGGRKAGGDWTARCPAHDDRRPSLSICETDNTRELVAVERREARPS